MSHLIQEEDAFTRGKSTDTNPLVYNHFTKALDRLDHQLLFWKFIAYRITVTLLCWFQAYLSDRLQTVRIDITTSNSI